MVTLPESPESCHSTSTRCGSSRGLDCSINLSVIGFEVGVLATNTARPTNPINSSADTGLGMP